MKLNYTFQETEEIRDYLIKLEAARRVIDLLPQVTQVEKNLRRKSLLKSSLFSAQIEGNPLEYKDIQYQDQALTPKDREKMEIFNVLKALNWLYSADCPTELSEDLALALHSRVMKGLTPYPGSFRKEPSAIFNQAGIAVYFTAPPAQVPALVRQLINKTASSKWPVPVKASIFHFGFEKIHPFLDGNGRVGRLISTFILKQGGSGFRGLVSWEEYLNTHRQTYYDLLTITGQDITAFVEFFLQALTVQVEKVLLSLKDVRQNKPEDSLLPRRREILEIIRDHQLVSFNFIKRRFLAIPSSTLHNDLRQLAKKEFIRKVGSTRGAQYAPLENV